MFIDRLDISSVLHILHLGGSASLEASAARMRALLRAQSESYYRLALSDTEMKWMFLSDALVLIAYAAFVIWSHYGANKPKPGKQQRFRSYTKRRAKGRKRKKTCV